MIKTKRELEDRLTLKADEEAWFDHPSSLPLLISDALERLIDPADPHDPIRRQLVPDVRECDRTDSLDPLGEVSHQATGRLIHRYGRRAALLTTDRCFAYCRHCFRRRFTGTDSGPISDIQIEEAASYLKEHGEITEVYWVACGGSLIDLYPSHFMMTVESAKTSSGWHTAKEFLVATPKKLGKHSMVVMCSHSGNTKEAVDAAVLAYERGAAVVTLTDNAGSKADDPRFIAWVYPWGDGVPTAEVPLGICPMLAAELIKAQEGFDKYDALVEGIAKMDGIIEKAKVKVNAELGEKFADLCEENKFFYILGSGANFSQTYGFAICSLMEMQWQNCCYIHSGEYFHGPFECTEPGVFYFLQMGSSSARVMDERALAFLKTHTDRLMVLDALEYGMADVDEGVRAYLEPALFYAMNVELRAARGKRFDHSPEIRRYMGIEKY